MTTRRRPDLLHIIMRIKTILTLTAIAIALTPNTYAWGSGGSGTGAGHGKGHHTTHSHKILPKRGRIPAG